MRKPWKHSEKYFATLGECSDVICSRPDHDEHGWDYFVEFPREDNPTVPLDMVAAPFKCLAQVKSTTARPVGIRLKLSNALEFAKLEAPCFNVLLCYSNGGQTPNYAIVHHFWENEIRDTLRRARLLDASGSRKAHSAHIALPNRSGSRVELENLFDHLLGIIKQHGAHYADKKRLFAKTLGFEESHTLGNIVYGDGVTLDDIVDLHLGLREELPISELQLRSVRFGIESPRLIADVKSGGTLQVSPSSRPCELIFSSETTGARAKIPAQIFTPGIPDLPKESMKVRVSTDFAECIFTFGTNRCNFRFDFQFDQPHSISDLLARAELMQVCISPEICVRVVADGHELFSGNGSTETFSKDGAALIPPAVAFLRQIADKDTEVRTAAPPTTTLATVFESLRRIETYSLLLSDARMKAQANFTWTDGPKLGKGICYYLLTVPLGKIVVCTLVRRSAEIGEEDSGRTPVDLGARTYFRAQVFDHDANYLETMRQEIDRLSDVTPDLPSLNLGDLLEAA